MDWALWMNSPIIGGEAFNAFKVIIQRNEILKGARLLMKEDGMCVNNDEWKRELHFLIIPDQLRETTVELLTMGASIKPSRSEFLNQWVRSGSCQTLPL